MTVINWVNTWLAKDDQTDTDIEANEILQDEQDGWVHLDVNPQVTVVEDESVNPLSDSIVNVVNLRQQFPSVTTIKKTGASSSGSSASVKPATSSSKVDDKDEFLEQNENNSDTTDEKENAGPRVSNRSQAAQEEPAKKLSRQERRYMERMTKKTITKNVKAATAAQKGKSQHNCVSAARSLTVM
ncbi:hypothetical protein INT43_001094 [Umbelopsis isabellina]|uniref:Uncharacterized protein n=1 Tax=Mortierella isabellina TaxID=91625 RepID=A0A8H7UBG7_MORIS|nr:hypothetical protein INT43_001094 [Umbelopsis isabellina]